MKKITGMKRGMTKTMTDALQIPAFTFSDEFSVDKLTKLRKELEELKGKITVLPFFIKAVSLALSEFPLLNIHVNPKTDDQGYITEYIEKKDHNIGVAIDSKDGLIVPNIKQVQNKSIIQINNELGRIRDAAAKGALTQHDLENGTFTISSVGMPISI